MVNNKKYYIFGKNKKVKLQVSGRSKDHTRNDKCIGGEFKKVT